MEISHRAAFSSLESQILILCSSDPVFYTELMSIERSVFLFGNIFYILLISVAFSHWSGLAVKYKVIRNCAVESECLLERKG